MVCDLRLMTLQLALLWAPEEVPRALMTQQTSTCLLNAKEEKFAKNIIKDCLFTSCSIQQSESIYLNKLTLFFFDNTDARSSVTSSE